MLCYNIASDKFFCYRKSSGFDQVGKTLEEQSKRIKHADRALRYLQQQDRPLSACDVLEGLRSDGVTASSTVYRAFEKLLNASRTRRIESLKACMIYCGKHDHQAPVFAISYDCGTVTDHIDADLNHSISGLSEKTSFEPNHSVLEIHARCSDCNTGVPAN